MGIRETSNNHFPRMEEIWSSTDTPTGYRDRKPYCAAFVCHVVELADKESDDFKFTHRPKSAACAEWMDWAREPRNGVLILPRDSNPQPGDIVQFRPHFSHIGIVADYDPHTREVETLEANTNGRGSRDGDGFYERSRPLAICGEFYRLPVKARAV